MQLLPAKFYFLRSVASGPRNVARRAGFTLIELVVFSAVFSVISITTISILLMVTRVQVRQNAAASVNQESLFLLQTIQRYVEQATLIDMSADAVTSTLKIRMTTSTYDPTYIYLASSTVYLKETDAGSAIRLTSDKILVTALTFVKRVNAGGHDTVNVAMTLEYNNPSADSLYAHSVETSVSRIGSARFNSNLLSAAAGTYAFGSATNTWIGLNNTIFFSGSRVGINAPSPQQKVEVNGGLRLNVGTRLQFFPAGDFLGRPKRRRSERHGGRLRQRRYGRPRVEDYLLTKRAIN